MVLWAIFAVELAGLVPLGVQRSVAERRGGEGVADPRRARRRSSARSRRARRARATTTGCRSTSRRAGSGCRTSRSPRRRSSRCRARPPSCSPTSPSEWCLPAFFLTGFLGTDVALVLAIIVGMWRGWLPLPDDGDDGDDDDELAPVPGGPFTRAHVFNLRR